MKNVIKLFAFAITVLCMSILTGCADFPDNYAVYGNVKSVRMKNDAVLSQDGNSYKTTMLVDFFIENNTFNEISSALVTINGVSYDVKNKINPSSGGIVEIPCELPVNKYVNVSVSLNIFGHEYISSYSVQPYNFSNNYKVATGNAENITPYSATLCVDTEYPWLIDSYNVYMLVKTEDFVFNSNSSISDFDGVVFNCTYNNSDKKLEANVNRLSANTTYYYKVVVKGEYVGETKTFKTTQTTAKISASISELSVISAVTKISFDPGDLAGKYGVYNYMNNNGGVIVLHKGKTLEELESGGTFQGTGIYYSSTFDKLEPNTKYYYRYDFKIDDGLMCSTGIQEFTTPASTASVTLAKNGIYSTYGNFKVSINKGNVASGFNKFGANVVLYYGESADDMSKNKGIYLYNDDSFDTSITLSNLIKNTKYYCKAYVYTNSILVAESEVMEFTTGN